jgi:hypothetical protein
MRVFTARALVYEEYKSVNVLQACATVVHRETCISISWVSDDRIYPSTD